MILAGRSELIHNTQPSEPQVPNGLMQGTPDDEEDHCGVFSLIKMCICIRLEGDDLNL